MIAPRDLGALLGAGWRNPRPDLPRTPFTDIVVDSRKVTPGSLFIALKGQQTDGHRFLEDAVRRGATGLLARTEPEGLPAGVWLFQVDDPLSALQAAARAWRLAQRARVVGITGSVGKTTTREAIAQALARRGAVLETPHNFNSEIGVPLTLLGLGAEHAWAVVELGIYSRAEMALLCQMAQPEIGVVTNVGPTHLERFGSLEAIEEGKGLLPASLPADGLAVLNGDDPRVCQMRRRTAARVITFGQGERADVRASEVRSHGLEGLSFRLHDGAASALVRSPLVGAHHVYTALAAAAVALGTGASLADTVEALGALQAGRRLQPRRAFSGALILDDTYNAAPVSMHAALDLLAELPGRRIAVLGDMLELGAEEERGHREVGAYAVRRCDRLIAIGPRARGIAEGAWEEGHPQIQWFEEKDAAAALLRAELSADDVVLIKASHGLALETLVEALVTP